MHPTPADLPGFPSVPLRNAYGGASLLDAWTAHVAVLDGDGRILEVNEAWRAFGRERGATSDFVGAGYLAVCDRAAEADPSAFAVAAGLRDVLDGRVPEFDVEYACPDGGVDRWFRVTVRSMLVGAVRLMVIHEDVTESRRYRDDVRTRSLLLDAVDAAVIATDLDGLVTTWNRAAERMYGWRADEALGRPLHRLTAPAQMRAGRETCGAATGLARSAGEFSVTRRDGTTFPAYVRNVRLTDVGGRPSGTVGVSVDLSDRFVLERQLARSNRELEAITHSVGEGLCTLDASGRITYVNPYGLRLLRARLEDAIGGTFLRWLHDPSGRHHLRDVPVETDVLRPVERQLIRGDGSDLPVEYVATPLIDEGEDEPPGWVVAFRDISERRKRDAGRLRHVEQIRWFERINHALEHEGLVLHAQPIVDLATGATVQHELLLRMRDEHDPDLLIPPGHFLPTAETLGLAPALDRWVLSRGLAIAATGLPVEINLSANSLDDPSLPDLIEELLERGAVDPTLVVFEVTETALVDNDDTARRFAERIHELGCGLALDDFGTGYGGFTYLKHLPVDYLKIDIEFVRDCVTQPASRHVVDAVVSLARAFGLRTVAEGVEDEATLAVLRELGVDLGQGYLFGHPAPIDERYRRTADPREP